MVVAEYDRTRDSQKWRIINDVIKNTTNNLVLKVSPNPTIGESISRWPPTHEQGQHWAFEKQ